MRQAPSKGLKGLRTPPALAWGSALWPPSMGVLPCGVSTKGQGGPREHPWGRGRTLGRLADTGLCGGVGGGPSTVLGPGCAPLTLLSPQPGGCQARLLAQGLPWAGDQSRVPEADGNQRTPVPEAGCGRNERWVPPCATGSPAWQTCAPGREGCPHTHPLPSTAGVPLLFVHPES